MQHINMSGHELLGVKRIKIFKLFSRPY